METKKSTKEPAAAAVYESVKDDNGKDEVNKVKQTIGGKSYELSGCRVGNDDETSNKEAVLQLAGLVVMAPILFIMAAAQALFFKALRFPKAWQDGITKFIQSKGCGNVKKRFERERRTLLQDSIGPDHRVLDVGCGDGSSYLGFLSNAKHIVALEPMVVFHRDIRQAAQEAGIDPDTQLTLVSENLEDYAGRESKKFDWIIVGNVLCEVPNIPIALESIHRLLKVGGRVYFSEHVGHDHGTLRRLVQDWFNPLWRAANNGCNYNRDTLETIREVMHDRWDVVSWHIDWSGFVWVLGLAVKKKE